MVKNWKVTGTIAFTFEADVIYDANPVKFVEQAIRENEDLFGGKFPKNIKEFRLYAGVDEPGAIEIIDVEEVDEKS